MRLWRERSQAAPRFKAPVRAWAMTRARASVAKCGGRPRISWRRRYNSPPGAGRPGDRVPPRCSHDGLCSVTAGSASHALTDGDGECAARRSKRGAQVPSSKRKGDPSLLRYRRYRREPRDRDEDDRSERATSPSPGRPRRKNARRLGAVHHNPRPPYAPRPESPRQRRPARKGALRPPEPCPPGFVERVQMAVGPKRNRRVCFSSGARRYHAGRGFDVVPCTVYRAEGEGRPSLASLRDIATR